MAGIKIPPGRHCQIFRSGTAAGKPLCHTGAALQIYHKMEEIECLSFLSSFQHFHSQFIVLFLQLRDVLLCDGIRICWLGHHRLHRDLLKAQIRKMQHIFGKVQIVMGKGPPHIIVHLPPALCHLLELGNDHVIAALAASEGPHVIVDFLSPIDT